MNIVILGAGTVGTSIADEMCAKRQNVVVVDHSRRALDDVEERLDVQVIRGSACDAVTLFQAGAPSADLCLAVTDRDEVNLVGASLAKAMGTRRSVARVFQPAILDTSTVDYRRHFGIDRLLSLERLTAVELAKAVRAPGLFVVESFARGGIEVQEVAVQAESKAAGVPLRDLKLPKGVRIGLIYNGRRARIAGANECAQAGDHVTLIGAPEELQLVKRLFARRPPPRLSVMIAGGGETGLHLARILEHDRFHVTIMEADAARCDQISGRLEHATVLHADATRQVELVEARVSKADVFVAATGHDEDNIVCGVEARELGAKRILSVVRRPDYANVLAKLGIDVAVSPREVMAREIAGMLEPGPILSRSQIAGGDAEILELEVVSEAPLAGKPLRELALPNALVVAVVREELVFVPGADDELRPGDIAVVLAQRDSLADVLALFSGSSKRP